MSSTSEPQSFLELQNDFIGRLKESRTASMVELAKRFLNSALVNCHRNPGDKFPWLERRGVLITHAPYQAGTVSITTATDRTAVVGASTLWNTVVPGFGFNNARTGGKIKFAGELENYVVSNVANNNALTLASFYMGSDLTSASYIYFEDEYSLAPDFDDFVDLQMFSTDMAIPLIGRTDFRRIYTRNDTFQKPKIATHIQVDFAAGSAATQHRVVFNPVPDREYQIPYWYKSNYLAVTSSGVRQSRMVNDTDEPVIPLGRRQAMTLYALYEYFRDYKDDAQRATMAQAEYGDFMKRICGEKTASDARPRFIAPRGRGGILSQRFDWGNRADTLGDFKRWIR